MEYLIKESNKKDKLDEEKLINNRKQWIKHFKQAPKGLGLVDHKIPQFYEKGSYEDPINQMNNLIRGEVEFKIPFQLCHRNLRKTDKTLFFGDSPPSKI